MCIISSHFVVICFKNKRKWIYRHHVLIKNCNYNDKMHYILYIYIHTNTCLMHIYNHRRVAKPEWHPRCKQVQNYTILLNWFSLNFHILYKADRLKNWLLLSNLTIMKIILKRWIQKKCNQSSSCKRMIKVKE